MWSLLATIQSTFGDQTLISVGVLVVLGVPALGVAFALLNKLNKLDSRLERMESLQLDAWTVKDQRIWELELKNRNQALDVPSSSDVWGKGRRK